MWTPLALPLPAVGLVLLLPAVALPLPLLLQTPAVALVVPGPLTLVALLQTPDVALVALPLPLLLQTAAVALVVPMPLALVAPLRLVASMCCEGPVREGGRHALPSVLSATPDATCGSAPPNMHMVAVLPLLLVALLPLLLVALLPLLRVARRPELGRSADDLSLAVRAAPRVQLGARQSRPLLNHRARGAVLAVDPGGTKALRKITLYVFECVREGLGIARPTENN